MATRGLCGALKRTGAGPDGAGVLNYDEASTIGLYAERALDQNASPLEEGKPNGGTLAKT